MSGSEDGGAHAVPNNEVLLASTAQYLIEGGEEDAASVLLSCSLDVYESGDTWFAADEVLRALHVEVRGPRASQEVLGQDSHPIRAAVEKAIDAILPADTYIKHFTAHASRVDIGEHWRDELLEIARGKGVHNQAVRSDRFRLWQGLRFRSETEIRVARALDQRGAMFFPKCVARLSSENDRVNREPDFLVCWHGLWGILEVDGEPFHPPSRTTADHARDRLFLNHDVRVVQHFDATECYNDPNRVVTTFLALLEKSG